MTDYSSFEAAFADGAFAPLPAEIEIDDDRFPYRSACVATESMVVADEDGTPRRLSPGDVLSRSECHAAGAGLAHLIRCGAVCRLPADRGLVGLVTALAGRQ